MRPIAATDLPPTVSHRLFGLGLITILLLRSVKVGDILPWLIRHQLMILITINITCIHSFKKKWINLLIPVTIPIP